MTPDVPVRFLLSLIAYGGGSAAVAYLLFQWLGQKWIENKFAQRLEQLRHQQALELQQLKVEVDAMLSGALKLQEREFAVLPEAWAKLDEAHGLVAWLVAPMQSYADVDRMTTPQLEEFLEGTKLLETQKDAVRNATNKGDSYREADFWHRLHRVEIAFGDLQAFVARNGIFLPTALEEKFAAIAALLWSAVVSKEIGHEAKDWKMQTEGWKRIKEEAEPLYKVIRADIQARLQSHGGKH